MEPSLGKGLVPFIVVSEQSTTPVNGVFVLVRPQSPKDEELVVGASPTTPPVFEYSVGSSSLTINEMKLVKDGGRQYSFVKKEWGYRALH